MTITRFTPEKIRAYLLEPGDLIEDSGVEYVVYSVKGDRFQMRRFYYRYREEFSRRISFTIGCKSREWVLLAGKVIDFIHPRKKMWKTPMMSKGSITTTLPQVLRPN